MCLTSTDDSGAVKFDNSVTSATGKLDVSSQAGNGLHLDCCQMNFSSFTEKETAWGYDEIERTT